VLDCPPGAARDAAIPLRHADRTLLVAPPSPRGLRDAAKTAAMARALDAPPVGAVLVDTTPRSPVERVTTAEARALLECDLVRRVPTADSRPLSSKPVRTAYAAVAKKVIERNT
jgi:septum site-determining protein MinD